MDPLQFETRSTKRNYLFVERWKASVKYPLTWSYQQLNPGENMSNKKSLETIDSRSVVTMVWQYQDNIIGHPIDPDKAVLQANKAQIGIYFIPMKTI